MTVAALLDLGMSKLLKIQLASLNYFLKACLIIVEGDFMTSRTRCLSSILPPKWKTKNLYRMRRKLCIINVMLTGTAVVCSHAGRGDLYMCVWIYGLVSPSFQKYVYLF